MLRMRWLPALLVFAILFSTTLACTVLTPSPGGQPGAPAAGTGTPAVPDATATSLPLDVVASAVEAEERLLENIYAVANPGVVNIQTDLGSGSGFVVDQDGHIVTNYHVIADAQQIEVVFADKTRAAAEVVGVDQDADLAVIRVEGVAPEQLVPLELGDSRELKVGQRVIAIGNPFGLVGTMTVGIVSGIGRTLPSDRSVPGGPGGRYTNPNVIQTDAAINPGNSGGPLLDAHGRVIGVNAAIRTDASLGGQPVNSGVGFAIPINTVKRIVPALIEDGRYIYPYLGISGFDELTLDVQRELGLDRSTGVYVTTVTEGGPAAAAGIRAGSEPTSLGELRSGGDLIIAIDGQSVRDFSDLIGYLVSEKSPGEVVTLRIMREGQELDVPVTLGERP
jgi:2-alkenal reductase